MKTENNCGNCGSNNTFGITRIVGYYSIIENWNESKKAELVDRKRGSYRLGEQLVMQVV
ncbi:hypothetical protein GOV05_02590 [Candidatus Woesearchaeota archaeon]|nr:hypothetical protein [Candidatus Woesearchaeota archaeon]